jgi:serine/threonine-protein kinase HipA
MNRKGQWSLSPAYDVTYAYNPNGKWTQEHQMLIHGKRSQFTKEDLLKSAQSMNIKESKAIQIIEEVKDSILNWKTFAKMAFVDEQTIDFIHQSHIIF